MRRCDAEYLIILIGYTTLLVNYLEERRSKFCLNLFFSVQGNLDPCCLYGSDEAIEAAVAEMVKEFGPGGRWIANLGHGIYPDMRPEAVQAFVEAVHKHSKTL
jgi:uroporphyrinogen-III decarboxylase